MRKALNGPDTELLMSPETIEKMYDIHTVVQDILPLAMEIPKLMTLVASSTSAATSIAESVKLLAETDAKREERMNKLEQQVQSANDKAHGKGFVPMGTHLISLTALAIFAGFVILYLTKLNMEATMTSIKVQQKAVAP